MADGGEQRKGAVAILGVGRVDLNGNQQATGVGKDMTLAALAFLPASWLRGRSPSVVFTLWLSMTPADGLASRPSALRAAIKR